MSKNLFLFVTIVMALISCTSNKDNKIENALQDLSTRHSILQILKDSSYLTYYTKIVSIQNHKFNINCNIFRDFHSKESVYVLTVEYKDKISAIPILPFSDNCYWNYENSLISCDTLKNNFQFEYNKMANDLGLTDKFNLTQFPFTVITKSILGFETVKLTDTTDLLTDCSWNNTDSLIIRNRKNTDQLIKLIHEKDFIFQYYAFKPITTWEEVLWASVKKNSKNKFELQFKAFSFQCPQLPIIEL